MTAQHQQQVAQAATQTTDNKSLLDQILDNPITYTPFMSDKPLTLSVRVVLRFFAKPSKSGVKCSPEQAAHFLRLCEARSLNPWEGDAYIVGYDNRDGGTEFNLITAYQAIIKRAETHPEYDGMECGVTVADEEGKFTDIEGELAPDGYRLVGGWARVYSKKKSKPTYRRLKLSAYKKPFGRWIFDAEGMIQKCAKATALRETFPNKLGGLYLAEEFDGGMVVERPTVNMPRPTHELPPIKSAQPATNGNGSHDADAVDDEPGDDVNQEQGGSRDADEANARDQAAFEDKQAAEFALDKQPKKGRV